MKFTKIVNMIHPGKKIIEEIRNRNWTQKQFAVFVGKKNSEVNELIKGKRNITIQRDLILSEVFGTPEKYWINMQIDYDYELAKEQRNREKQSVNNEFQVISEKGQNITKEFVGSVFESEKDTLTNPDNLDNLLEQDYNNINITDNCADILGQKDNLIEQNDEELIKQIRSEKKKIFLNF